LLVLTRRVDEEIVIGDDIVVKVVAVHGDKVRIGIKAPRSIPVDRREVHERRTHDTAQSDCTAAVVVETFVGIVQSRAAL
jgi:carbon storage regulator